MEFTKDIGHIYSTDDSGNIIAEILFADTDSGKCSITRTFVDDSLRGQGVAGALMDAAVAQIRERGIKATPVCSYAVKWFESHPEGCDVKCGDAL